MADGSAKRAKILTLSRLPKLTDRTLEKLNGGGFSRNDIRRTQIELGRKVLRPLQLQLNNGGGALDIVCANPLLLMQWFAEECPAYKMLLERSAVGDAPLLSVLLYLDEVTPGDPLQPVLNKKFYMYYMSFAEFGPEVLFREEVWLTIAVFRTVMLKDIKASTSGATRSLLRHMFLDGSPNFKVGAAFRFDPPKLIRAKLVGVIADAAALKAMFHWKGASGLKPCIECDNLWMKNSRIELPNAVTLGCFDSSLYEKRSDEDVWDAYDTLQAQLGIVGVGFFKDLERGCGLKLVPGSLLEDVELRDVVRPVSHKIDDWPHIFFQSGLFNVEFRLLLDRCEEKETNIGWHTFRECSAADWKFPKDHAAVNRSLSEGLLTCSDDCRTRYTAFSSDDYRTGLALRGPERLMEA